jgi:hypothetical protein
MRFMRSRFPISIVGQVAYGVAASLLFACLVVLLGSVSTAQNANSANSSSGGPAQTDKKTYVSENGTQTITQTQETERKVTSDGEVEIQRFRSSSWPGDEAVTWEREVRTKKLPDGTIEKEYVVKNPDGANHLTPVQVIHEKITPGKDSTTIEREMLRPDYEGHLQPIQKETVTEKGPETAKQIIKDIQQPDTTGAWQVVERQVTSSRSSAAGKETQSVRQVPDAFGRLADYERRQVRTATQAGKETHEVTLQRRDFSDTDARQFNLVEHTTMQSTTTGSGTTIRHVVTESDLLPGSPMRNFESTHPEVTEQRTEEERTAPDGTKQTFATVSERTAGDPTAIRPAYKMIQQTDRNGYVRQIFIPAQ